MEVLASLNLAIPVVGLVKDERHRTSILLDGRDMEEIDLKKLALAIKDKKVEMLPLKQLLSTTGYMRGGCSPLGMKKSLPTYFDSSCLAYEKLSVSAGVRGMQMLVNREDLLQITKASCIAVTKIDK